MFGSQALTLTAPPADGSRRGTALSATLTREDIAEEHEALTPHDRITCPLHRRWVHQCTSSPAHAIRLTGHRWCRACDSPVNIAVDELTGAVTLTCPRCHRSPDTAANRQLLRSCRASIEAARQNRFPALAIASSMRAA